jgi:hypothetical protein
MDTKHGFWVSGVPVDFDFTGRIKYIKHPYSKTKIEFEISWLEIETPSFIAFLVWVFTLSLFHFEPKYKRVTMWIGEKYFYASETETIVECQK